MKESERFWVAVCFLVCIQKGSGQTYTCGSLLRESSGQITSPNNDGDEFYDPNERCRWTILAEENKMVQLTVSKIDIEEYEDCYNDYLAVHDGNELKGYFCGNSTPPAIRCSSRVVYVTFVSNEIMNGKGFEATYEQINDSDCGQSITLMAGSFRSADMDRDGHYENNVVCLWMIERLSPDHLLQLLVIHLDIQDSEDCEDDYIMIRADSITPIKYCGTTLPPVITTSSRFTFILFLSNHNMTGSGFTAVYTNADNDGQCGGILTEASGIIRSPDSDGDLLYDNDLECLWVIAVPDDYIIELNFSSMDIEWHKNCEWDHLRIFDGIDTYPFDGLVGWYCGSKTPDNLLSKSTIVFLEFVSDQDYASAGFEARYFRRHINETFGRAEVTYPRMTTTTELTKVWTSSSKIGNGTTAMYRLISMLIVLCKAVTFDRLVS